MRDFILRKQRILSALGAMKAERDGAKERLQETLTELEAVAGLLNGIWSFLPAALREGLEKYRR